jgi:hypothetical protein
MNTQAKTEVLVSRLNTLTLGHDVNVEWNTPFSFHLTSYRPGTKRIYTLERNTAEGSGVNSEFTGSIREVYTYVRGLLEGLHLAGEIL